MLDISNARSSFKLKCHKRLVNKPNDPKTAPEVYWTILKTFPNCNKISLIPSLEVDNKLVTDLLEKTSLFNNFFTKQYNPISNNNTVPISINF